MTSEIRTNSFKSRAGLSTVTMTDSGPMFSGITTFVDNSGFTFGVGGGTSIFTPATNILTLGTNNTEKVRIDANGNTNITGVTTAANFKTGVSNLHDVGLTLSGGQIDVGSNIKIGTAGVTTSASFHASTGLHFTSNNGVIQTGSSGYMLGIQGGATNMGGRIELRGGSSDGDIRMYAQGATSTQVERLRIKSDGKIGIGDDNPDRELVVKNASSNSTIKIESSNAHTSQLFFSDTDAEGVARISVFHGSGTGQNTLNFETAGSSRLAITSAGNIGINQISPTALLHVSKSYTAPTGGFDSNIVAAFTNSGSGAYAGLAIQGGSGAGSFIHFGDTDDSNTGIINYEHSDNSFRFTVNTDQRLKVTHADTTLYGTTDGVLNITTTDSRGSFIRFQESASTKVWVGCGQGLSLGGVNDLGLRATNDIRMRAGSRLNAVLTAEGYFAAKGLAGSWVNSNTDPASSQFHQFTQTGTGKRIAVFRQEHHAGLGVSIEVSSTTNAEALYVVANGVTRFRVLNSGNVSNTNNSYGSISDIKLKENIVDANSQWDDLKAIKVRNFNFKNTPDTKMLGVVAQEIETISPGLISEVVDRDPNTNESLGTTTKEVKYSILYMKAIKALQEAMTRIETLEQDNIALRARVTNLEGN